MNIKKLLLLIVLIFAIGIGNNAIAGHRRHHHHHGCGHNVIVKHRHYRGCGHSGWSLKFSFAVSLNPSPSCRSRTLVLVPEHVTTEKVWVKGYYELREQPSVNVWIEEHWETRGCDRVLVRGHYELRSSPPVEVWIREHWKNIDVLVPEHYEELR